MVDVVARISPANGILTILEAVPELTAGGWALAFGRLVESNSPTIVVMNSGGRSAEPAIAQDYPSVQLLARGSRGSGSYDATWTRLDMCRQALIGIPSRPAQYPALSSVTAIGDIQDLGYDDKDRPMFSTNFQLIMVYESSGYREALG